MQKNSGSALLAVLLELAYHRLGRTETTVLDRIQQKYYPESTSDYERSIATAVEMARVITTDAWHTILTHKAFFSFSFL